MPLDRWRGAGLDALGSRLLIGRRVLLDDASIAAMIDTGSIPPLAELLAMDDRGELP